MTSFAKITAALAATLVLAGSVASTHAHGYIGNNGVSLNGWRLNGTSFNGYDRQGTQISGDVTPKSIVLPNGTVYTLR